MKYKFNLLVIIVSVFFWTVQAFAIAPIPINSDLQQYIATLNGDEAIPPQNTGAYGKAFIGINQEMTQITYRVEVFNIYDVLMATIRLGFPGKEGPLVIWLFPDAPPPTPLKLVGRFDGVLAEGIITEVNLVGRLNGHPLSDLVQEIENGRVFIQVDTLLHQIGELRGQIEPLN